MEKIVICDDNLPPLKRLKKFISSGGYSVYPFENSDLLAKQIKNKLEYDLLITDLTFDSCINTGEDLAELSKQEFPKIPVILITGYSPFNSKYINLCLDKIRLDETLLPAINRYLKNN